MGAAGIVNMKDARRVRWVDPGSASAMGVGSGVALKGVINVRWVPVVSV